MGTESPADMQQVEDQIVGFLRQATHGLTTDSLRFLVVQAEELQVGAALRLGLLTGKIEATLKPELGEADHVTADDFTFRLREGSEE